MNLSTMSASLHVPGTTKASPSDVRRSNRALIFGLLFPSASMSRAELGRRTGLSRVAVSDVVADMLDEGLIRETGPERSPGKGKRGTLLAVDAERLRVVGVDLSQAHLVQGAVMNLLGGEVRRAERTLDCANHVTLDAIVGLVGDLLDGMPDGRVIGIGVAAPGVVSDGVVRRSTVLDWRDVDLRTPLEERFGIPVSVDNDATCDMLTERFHGRGGPNLLFVRVRRGIGAGVLIGDVPVTGENHAGGEIGHISLDPEGPACPCGKRGCLERLISESTLRHRMEGLDADGRRDVLREAGTHLAQALAMPVGLLDMADVCVYGPPDIVNDDFIDAAQRYMDAATGSSFHAPTTVRRCQCGADITLRGTSIAVVRDHLERR